MTTKLKDAWDWIVDAWGWTRSLWICKFKSIRHPATFRGFNYLKWACQYADKRSSRWRPEWDQSGRRQGIFPFREGSLIVCSAMELKAMKKMGVIGNKTKPRKAIKKALYTTVA